MPEVKTSSKEGIPTWDRIEKWGFVLALFGLLIGLSTQSLLPFSGQTTRRLLVVPAFFSIGASLLGIFLSMRALRHRRGEINRKGRTLAKWGVALGVMAIALTYSLPGYLITTWGN